LRPQPDAHLRHDPEIRLHEEAVDRGTEPAASRGPIPRGRQRTQASAQDIATGEYDLHPALTLRVVSQADEPHAVVEGVADDAAPTDVGDRLPQGVTTLL